jgi:hypothetical protein
MHRALVATLVMAIAASVSTAAEPVKIDDAKDKQIVAKFLDHAAKVSSRFTPEACKKRAADSTESYTWVVMPQVDMLLTAYQLTGDAKYLDMFVATFDNMRSALTKGPDGYLGWYGKALGSFQDPKKPDMKVDVIITTYRAVEMIAEFVEAIDKEPGLKRKYADKRKAYLDLAQNHLARKWVARSNYVDLGKEGGIFRTHFGLRDVKGRLTQPHNKHSIIIRAMLALHRVTGEDEYMTIAIKLGTRFKRCLRLKDGHYEWDYWDPAGAWDVHPSKPSAWKHWIGVEHKGGYMSSSLSQAVALYHHGVVFDRKDIGRFLKTQLTQMWNGSMADPKWARCDGTTSKKYMKGSYMCAALAPFNGKIAEFLYTGPRQDGRLKSAPHAWQGGPVANGWLSGKYVTCPAAKGGKASHAEFGKTFLRDAANQRLAKSLAFAVTGSGYKAPRAPGEMKPMPPEPK